MNHSRYYLLAILLLAAGLRIFDLGSESLWLDEGFTARRAHGTFMALLSEMRHETQGIAYYCAEWLWCRGFGTSEFSLRFLSVIFGILAVGAVYQFARLVFDRNAALLSALLLAVNPFAIFYSQDARPYSLFLAATAFSLAALLRLLKGITRWRIAAYLFFTVLALYTQPLGPLLLPIHLLLLLVLRGDAAFPAAKPETWRIIRIGVLAAIFYIPQLLLQSNSIIEKIHGVGRASWIVKPSLIAPLYTFNTYFMQFPLGITAAVIILAGLWIGWRRKSDRRGIYILLIVIGGFVVVPWLESLVASPVYVDRYTIPALTAVMILIGWSLSLLGRYVRYAVLTVFLALSVYVLYPYYALADKDPWRATAEAVAEQTRMGGTVVLYAPYTKDVFNYYFRQPANVTVLAPQYGKRFPAEIDTAASVVLVESYVKRPDTRLDSLLARISDHHFSGGETNITERLRRNPGAFWIADIRLRTYWKQVTEDTENSATAVDTR
ncbi:MAG: glycosyltransferase family 39 protein [Calditrichota bacterium]